MIVILLIGKAKDVFKYIELLAEYRGTETLGQIIEVKDEY